MSYQITHLPLISLENHPLKSKEQINKKSSVKILKNQSSIPMILDFQKMHKIQLKTLSIVNNYLQKIPTKNRKNSNPNTFEKFKFNEIQQRKIRSNSLPIKNQQKVAQNAQKINQNFQQLKQNLKLHKIEKKLNKAKQYSANLTQQIQSSQKQAIQARSDLNCMGNAWLLNIIDPAKLKWRKINKLQARKSRAGQSLDFYSRKMTSDYESQKMKINSRIRKLQKQKLQRSKSQIEINDLKKKKIQNLKIKQSLNQNQESLMSKNLNKSNQSSQSSQRKFEDLSNFYFESKNPQKLKIRNKQNQKLKLLNSQQQKKSVQKKASTSSTKRILEINFNKSSNFFRQKTQNLEIKNKKKLYL